MYISSAANERGVDGLGMVLNLCTHKCLVPPQPRLSSSAYAKGLGYHQFIAHTKATISARTMFLYQSRT